MELHAACSMHRDGSQHEIQARVLEAKQLQSAHETEKS